MLPYLIFICFLVSSCSAHHDTFEQFLNIRIFDAAALLWFAFVSGKTTRSRAVKLT